MVCNKHKDLHRPKVQCRKNLSFTPGDEVERAITLRRLKMWLLLGESIPRNHVTGRTAHKDVDFLSPECWTEEELDNLEPVVEDEADIADAAFAGDEG